MQKNPALKIFLLTGTMLISACAESAAPPLPPPPPAKPHPILSVPAQPPHNPVAVSQQVFATPQQAVDALVAATRENNKADLAKILGPHAGALLFSGDKVADRQSKKKFLAAYDDKHDIISDGDDRDVLVIGEDEWPMPVPLAHVKDGWQFDTNAGAQEILNRRIGRNELNVLEVCRSYVEAQNEFAAQNPNHDYAQHFQSSKNQHDGLYWPSANGEDESPFGPLIANATAEGYSAKALGNHTPYHGYYYKILTGQGPHAPSGEKDYMVDGHMKNGFALIAFPAKYGDSGVMTFIVNQNGIVYQKNLGPDTIAITQHITQFDPDESWSIPRE